MLRRRRCDSRPYWLRRLLPRQDILAIVLVGLFVAGMFIVEWVRS